MIAPCVSSGWFDMDHAFSADWCHWCGIKRKHAFHGFISREVRVLCTGTHHVECDVNLLKILAPVREMVSFWCACSYGAHVVFPHLDHALCDVCPVYVRRGVLMLCDLFSYEVLNIVLRFVV